MPAEGSAPVFTTGRLGTVERLGHETLAHYLLGSNGQSLPCIARLSGDLSTQLAETAPLTIRDGAWRLFAGDEAGKRLG